MAGMDSAKRVALVTGGSRGIGAAVAERLARDGLRVAITGRARDELERVASAIGATVVVADMLDRDAPGRVLAEVERACGPVDVLVNNAGVAESAPLDEVSDDQWERTFAVNVSSVFRLCRGVMPAMAKRGYGRVINVASNAGLTGYAYTAAYCASKHAVIGLTRALAAEFGRTPVTINAVCPGWVDTDMAQRAVDRIASASGRSAHEARKTLEQMSPQRRLITVGEVAHAVAMLVPEDARGIHGQCIVVDGGQVMK